MGIRPTPPETDMRKTVLPLLLAASAITSAASHAQTPTTPRPPMLQDANRDDTPHLQLHFGCKSLVGRQFPNEKYKHCSQYIHVYHHIDLVQFSLAKTDQKLKGVHSQ